MKLLVCGGRTFNNWELLRDKLTEMFVIQEETRPFPHLPEDFGVVHGGAKGADDLADQWAVLHGVVPHIYKADWEGYGIAAGPIRNQKMLDEGKPDIVVAFPGGSGTADIVARARKAGVKVIEVKDENN